MSYFRFAKHTLCTIFCLLGIQIAIAAPTPKTLIPKSPHLNAGSYLLMDFHSNRILAEQNANKKLEPASLTKMMTVYVIDHELKKGTLQLEDTVLISKKAWQMPGSRMFVKAGDKVSVKDLLTGIVVQSGNDASVAMAEHIAGSEEAFAELMNVYASALGMNSTHFANVSGLPHPNHYSTASDMVRLAKAIIQDFPETYKLYSQKSFTYQGINQPNRNRLLWINSHVDGIKTGQTDSAGFCLVASAKQDDMRLISVVMGAKNDQARTRDSNSLLNWGFRFYETKRVLEARTPIEQTRVWLGKSKSLALGSLNDMYITVPKGQFKQVQTAIDTPKSLKAPIEEGQAIGTLKITLDEQVLEETPLYALQTINEASFFKRVFDHVGLTFDSLVSKISG